MERAVSRRIRDRDRRPCRHCQHRTTPWRGATRHRAGSRLSPPHYGAQPLPVTAGEPEPHCLEGKATAGGSSTVINKIIVRIKPRVLAQHRCCLRCSGLLGSAQLGPTRAPQIAPTPAASGRTAVEGWLAGTPSRANPPPNLQHSPAAGDTAPGEPRSSRGQPLSSAHPDIREGAPASRWHLYRSGH